jgi:hypothetical protein
MITSVQRETDNINRMIMVCLNELITLYFIIENA